MKEHRIAIAAAVGLLLLGGIGAGLRYRAMRRARLDRGDTCWRISYDIMFLPERPGARLRTALPSDILHARIFRESFARQSLSMDIVLDKMTAGREAVAVAAFTDRPARFSAEFDIHLGAPGKLTAPLEGPVPKKLAGKSRVYWLRKEPFIQTHDPRVVAAATDFRERTGVKGELVDLVFAYCTERLVRSHDTGPSDAATVIAGGAGTPAGVARAMVALCRACGIPSRTVAGFVLHPGLRSRPHVWVEVCPENRWVPYDPERGYSGELPYDYLPVRRGGVRVAQLTAGTALETRYSVEPILPPPNFLVSGTRGLVDVFVLTRLPRSMQTTLAVLLLMPLGALITGVFRSLIGVQTFGTFTPSLLALTFLYADWRTGMMVFVITLIVGLTGRTALERMRLLMVPRLSVILTLVVLTLTLVISAMDYLGLTPSAHAVLLPLVIVTMMIERFHVSAEESGVPASLRLLLGTVFVAACCFVALRCEVVGAVVLSFPESLCLVAAALILIGRYSGYRLVELWRFRDLAQPRNGGPAP